MSFAADGIARGAAWLAAQFQAERERWLLWMPVLLGGGAKLYFEWPEEPSYWGLAAVPVLALGCCWPRWPAAARMALIILLLLAAGWSAAQLSTMRMTAPILRRAAGTVNLTGRVVMVDPAAQGMNLLLDDLSIEGFTAAETPRRVRLKLRDADMAAMPPPGSRAALRAMLTPPQEPVAPGAYDFRRHAFFSGIGAQGFARGEIQILAPPPLHGNFTAWVESLRAAVAAHVARVLDGDAAAITVALLNGAQSGISKPALSDMRASGLQHILSISGLHLAIVAALVYTGLRGLFALFPYIALRWPVKKIAAGLSLLNLAAYTLLVGAPVPAVRSAIMTALVMIAVLFDRRALSLRSVALAASMLLLIVPEAVLGAGFQMSFAAVTVMIAGYEAWRQYRRRRIGMGRAPGLWRIAAGYIGAIAATSLLAEAATAPFTLYNFQQLNWYGVIANMIAIPLTSFWIMPVGFLSYFLMPFDWDAGVVAFMGEGVAALMAIAGTVAAWPHAMIRSAAPPAYAFALILFGGLWLCLWARSWRSWGVIPILAGVIWCFFPARTDIYIAPDFANWAVRADGDHWVAAHGGARDFILGQWTQRNGGGDFTALKKYQGGADAPLPGAQAPSFPGAQAPSFHCDDLGCVYIAKGRRVALAFNAAALAEDCGQADVILTPLWRISCPGATVIDGRWVKYHGATSVALSADAPPDIRAVRQRWGARPWSPGWRGSVDVDDTAAAPASVPVAEDIGAE